MKPNQTKHTPTPGPWRLSTIGCHDINSWTVLAPTEKPNNWGVVLELGCYHVQSEGSQPHTDANHIIHCVNTHDEMLEALGRARAVMIEYGKFDVEGTEIGLIDQAIAKARGES